MSPVAHTEPMLTTVLSKLNSNVDDMMARMATNHRGDSVSMPNGSHLNGRWGVGL